MNNAEQIGPGMFNAFSGTLSSMLRDFRETLVPIAQADSARTAGLYAVLDASRYVATLVEQMGSTFPIIAEWGEKCANCVNKHP
jgi:hypothetical protein